LSHDFRKVSVVGLGYVGLPTAAMLATHGVEVIGVDVNPRAVETINTGKSHIVEPELEAVLSGVVAAGRLRATITPEPADCFIIAVPTPFCADYNPDLTYIENAANSVAPVLERGNLVILESTSPVGTTEKLTAWLASARPDLRFPAFRGDPADISVVYCPERVLPGQVLHELASNDRLIGGMTRDCGERAQVLYQTFVRGQCLLTDPRTAEMAKLSENAYRDVNIAFANELALVCEKLDINVWELIDLANRHPRVNILQPGPGVGGHCIAVDPWFIVHSARELTPLIQAARRVNDCRPHHVVERVLKHAARLHDPVIACLGLSYKADIDDLRESPALEVVDRLASGPGQLLVVEPHIKELPPRLAAKASVRLATLKEAVSEADIVVLLVNHRAFKLVDRQALMEKIVVDTRGLWR
jgi:UDP-N-acetyl-D-mannosaminuronic acid dehydrogenase